MDRLIMLFIASIFHAEFLVFHIARLIFTKQKNNRGSRLKFSYLFN